MLAIGSLVALQAFAGTAGAADTRVLFIGEDGGTNRVLEYTPVSAGGLTKSDIYVKNLGKQNLTKAHLLIGIAPASALPADVTVDSVFGPDSGVCTVTSTTVDCNFDTLTARGDAVDRLVSVVLSVATAGTYSLDAAIKVAESVPDVGSNRNYAIAVDSVVAGESTCDSSATFFKPGVTADLGPGAACADDPQRSALHADASANGNALSIDDSSDTGGCLPKLKCFGFRVDAIVNDGAAVDPYLVWQVSYSAAVMKGVNAAKVGFVHDGFVIRAGAVCSATLVTNCIEGVSEDAYGTTYLVRTPGNGSMKGFS
jgi:hypothetical protein